MEELLFVPILITVVFAILTKDGELFAFIPKVMFRITNNHDPAFWLHKVTWSCPKCVSGQVCLWYGLATERFTGIEHGIASVTFCIFATYLLSSLVTFIDRHV